MIENKKITIHLRSLNFEKNNVLLIFIFIRSKFLSFEHNKEDYIFFRMIKPMYNQNTFLRQILLLNTCS